MAVDRAHQEGSGGAPAELGPFAYRFTPSPAAIRVARYVLAAWLERQPGVDVDGVDDLLIVCSELCSNAVLHSTGKALAVELRARVEGDAVVLEVEDDGEGFGWADGIGPEAVEAAAESGRGLYIVSQLTDDLQVDVGPDRTVVRAERRGMLRHREAAADRALSADFRSRENGRRLSDADR